VLIWVCIAAAIGALVLVGRWRFSAPDQLGRRKRFPSIAVPVLLVVAAATGWVSYSHHQLEVRLSAVASQLVGAPVKVHCQTVGESFLDAGAEAGYVVFRDGIPEHKTLIKRDTCNALRAFEHSTGANPTPDEIAAVHVLTHESMHMAGTTSESVAECKAMQRDAVTARLLGASSTDAAALARRYWLEDYPRMQDDYQSAQCGPRLALDEKLPDAPWNITLP
jgi:hypothetical protein